MLLRITAAVFALALASPLSAQKPAAQKPAARTATALQGMWVVQSINEKPSPQGASELSLTFSGGNYHQTYEGKVNAHLGLAGATTRPTDLTATEGSLLVVAKKTKKKA